MFSDIMMRSIVGEKTHSQNKYILCKSSAHWNHGRCDLILKSLSNHNVKPLVSVLFLLLGVIYGLGEKLHTFVACIFIPQYHYPYPVALCFGQVVISLLFLNMLHLLGAVPLQSYSRVLGEKLLVPSICSSIHGVLSMWAKANSSNAGLFPLVIPLLPLLTMSLSFLLKLPCPLSTHTSVFISLFSAAAFVSAVSRGVPGVSLLEYIYAPLAMILFSISLIWLAKVSDVEHHRPLNSHASVFDIYYVQLANQSGVLGILWLLHSDKPWHVLSQGSWQTLLFHGYLSAILLLGMVLTFFVVITVLCFSPLAAALLHSAYQIILSFLQFM